MADLVSAPWLGRSGHNNDLALDEDQARPQTQFRTTHSVVLHRAIAFRPAEADTVRRQRPGCVALGLRCMRYTPEPDWSDRYCAGHYQHDRRSGHRVEARDGCATRRTFHTSDKDGSLSRWRHRVRFDVRAEPLFCQPKHDWVDSHRCSDLTAYCYGG